MQYNPIVYNYPMKFPKINTLWKRDPELTVKKKGVIMPGYFSEEVFKSVKYWTATEKIDGENIRIFIDFIPGNLNHPTIWIGSRNDTDTPNINKDLIRHINTRLTEDALLRAFTKGSFSIGNCPRHAMIFGEGFGGDIKHGHNYRDSPEFIIFNVVIDGWFLEYNNVADISRKLNLQSVPIIGKNMSTEDIVDYVKGQPKSIVANKPYIMEGVVATSSPLLLTRKGYPLRFKLKTKDFRDLDSVSKNNH